MTLFLYLLMFNISVNTVHVRYITGLTSNYEGNCQDSRHEAHGGKYLLTGRFEFF